MDHRNNEIAIIGMSCIFPGAPDLATFWHNIVTGKDAFADLPECRLSRAHYDPAVRESDRVYCIKGGFIDPHASFEPLAFGITPTIVEDGEPDQFLALKVARQALLDAGYNDLKMKNVAVIIGRGSYQNSGGYRYNQRIRTGLQLIAAMKRINPLFDEDALNAMRNLANAELGPFRPENTIGLVPSFTAAWIANRMDFHGPAYTVDAACASSLLAVKGACEELRSGNCDMAITGGLHILLEAAFWAVFCHLNIMSRKHEIRPLSRSADGLLIGEGIGMLVMRRLEDAIRDGDRIYAVLGGVGVASDGRETSIMKPLMQGQIRAIDNAWRQTDFDRRAIGLIEAHSPGTPVGDKTELTTLLQYFGPYDPAYGPRAVVGSVKSNIGHTMPAAGSASLIKAVLAIHHGILPPSLRCEDPHELVEETRFRVIGRAEPWGEPPARRLAGVNSFGFGGTNAHVVLEGFDPQKHDRRSLHPVRTRYLGRPRISEVQLVEAADKKELLAKLSGKNPPAGADTPHPCRLAIWDPTPDKIAKAQKIVEKGLRWHGRNGIYYAPGGLIDSGGKVAFVFPGIEAQFHPDLEDLARHLGLVWPEFLGTLVKSDENGRIAPEELEKRGVGSIMVSEVLDHALKAVGIRPDFITGHSIGEWSGLLAAGMFVEEEVHALIDATASARFEVPDVDFGFVGCSVAQAGSAIKGLADISISHDNCPHQTILCGKTEVMHIAFQRLQKEGIICKSLPFRSGFHSPLFTPYLDQFARHIKNITLGPPSVPVWSAMTVAPLPPHADQVRTILQRQMAEPVRFTELVGALYGQGVRLFIQVGSGSLCGFIDDILHKKEHVALDANAPKYEGLMRLVHVALAMHVEGAKVNLGRLPLVVKEVFRPEMKLDLGTMPVPFNSPKWDSFAEINRAAILSEAGWQDQKRELNDPSWGIDEEDDSLVSRLFMSNLRIGFDAQKEVVGAFRSNRDPSRTTVARPESVSPREGQWSIPFSSALYPEVLDHAFFKQPKGWPWLTDLYPVAPMTMMVEMMMEEAAKLVDPALIPIRVENVRASRWLSAEPSVEIMFKGRFDGVDCVQIAIEGYASARVIFALKYPKAPAVESAALSGEKPIAFSVDEMYKRHMFHGPGYHGVIRMDAMGDASIRGRLRMLEAKGNLLDTAGQLFGLWVILNSPVQCMPFPVQIRSISFFGPPPRAGDEFDCDVRNITPGLANDVAGDLDLIRGGEVWCRIVQWQDFRVLGDERTDRMLRFPSTELISQVDENGLVWFLDRWPEWNQKERMLFRYTSKKERKSFDALDMHQRVPWIFKSLIAKDALRNYYFTKGRSAIFPVEIMLDLAVGDEIFFTTAFADEHPPHLAVACADAFAVAMVREEGPVGLAVETVDPARRSYSRRELIAADRAIVLDHVSMAITEDAWAARIHAARVAADKRQRKEGRDGEDFFRSLNDIRGEHLLLGDIWVATIEKAGYVIAWTLA